MAAKKTLNASRLSKREVQALISSGARPRQDLSSAFEAAFGAEYRDQTLVYELDGERYLFVFGGALFPGLAGKGDIYSADALRRFVRWTQKVDDDSAQGRGSSLSHWCHYSQLKQQLILNVDGLVLELSSRMSHSPEELDLTYRSLDILSRFVEDIGVERAQTELYDHLVAYVGEVIRLRIRGRWQLNDATDPPHPYIAGSQYRAIMPINVVWQELSGLSAVNLRAAAGNEVRRARLPSTAIDVARSDRISAPIGLLGTVATNTYEVTKRHADGRPAMIQFITSVEVAGLPCKGEAWVNRKGGFIGVTLSAEHVFGTRRFGAGSFVRYSSSQENGLLSDVKLGTDQEIDGLRCGAGTLVMFDRKQRLASLTLGAECEIDGIPCAKGSFVEFQSGRLSVALLAREHVLSGRKFPPGTWVYLLEGHLRRAMLSADWDMEGMSVQAGSMIELDWNGHIVSVTHSGSPPAAPGK